MVLKDLILKLHNDCTDAVQDNFNNYSSYCKNSNPNSVYIKYFRGSDSVMRQVDRLLFTNYPVKLKIVSPKKERFSVTSIGNISIYSIVKKQKEDKDENYHFRKGLIFNSYNKDTFTKAVSISMAIHLEYYEISSLTLEHIYYIVLHTAWTYFKMFDKNNKWIFNNDDIYKIYRQVLETDISVFEEVSKTYSMDIWRQKESEKKILNLSFRKPETVDDIMHVIRPDMTQTEKKEAIMKAFNCGQSKARQYMARFGLTNRKYERSDYVEKRLDDISEQIDIVSDQIDVTKSEICNCIEMAKSDLKDSLDIIYRTMIDYKTGFTKN